MSTEDEKILEQLKKDFVDEVAFYLEQCEESYLKLEQPELRTEEIGKIFRLAHSIKGSGAALGFADFSNFAHLVEDCLSILRDHVDLIQPEIVSLLLKTTDALKEKIENIRQEDDSPWLIDDLREELIRAIHQLESHASHPGTPAPVAAAPAPVAATPAPAAATPAPAAGALTEFDIDFSDPRFAPNPTLTAPAPTLVSKKKESPAETPAPVAATPAPVATAEPVSPLPPATKEPGIWKELADDTKKILASPDSAEKPSAVAEPMKGTHKEPTKESGPREAPKDAAHNTGQSQNSSSVKIETERIDSILNVVGELVVIKSQLMNQATRHLSDLKLNAVVSLMDKTIRDLQDKTLTMRMTPLKSLFLKLQRTARDLSTKLGKPLEFKVSGEETEIDRNMVELLGDPLLHICRNSIDHGLETPDGRKLRNKSERGVVHLSARQTGGRVVIQVSDDGGGLNAEKILDKAKKLKLVPDTQTLENMPEKTIHNIIFMPGFSTAEKITDVSGRGVGMDVVRSNIEKLRGSIEISSEFGVGTTITISLPLTTSITDGMLVEVGQNAFVIPMNTIHELVNADQSSSIRLHVGQNVLNHRGKFLPILSLRDLLIRQSKQAPELGLNVQGNPPSAAAGPESIDNVIIIVETGTRFIALRLEKILGQVQVVHKSLGPTFNTTRGISGATILGDGKVALVLDPIGLADYAKEQDLEKRNKKAGDSWVA